MDPHRFTFNKEVGRCEQFVYGGCGASENVFLTMEECVAVCMLEPAPDTETRARARASDVITFPGAEEGEGDVCALPPVSPGPLSCAGFARKWTFSQSEGACVPYIYGGCRATRNLFATEAACKAQCPGRGPKAVTAAVCSEPLVSGPCEAFIPSFGFNAQTGRCEPFVYGGGTQPEPPFISS